MSAVTLEKYASLGKILFEAFQCADQKGLDCPIIKLIEDCDECPFGKACDLIIELEKHVQVQGNGRTQKEMVSYPWIDAKAVIEFLTICEEPLAIEIRQMLVDFIKSHTRNAELGLVVNKGFTEIIPFAPCAGNYESEECNKIVQTTKGCVLQYYCRLRDGKGGAR
ncbi:hypothetical protein SRRS_07010 [Sporomusa rhizae]|uniref:hypothetical protein n=1 Tax=Sporomusa rhizae TaxID=357999 RepID=UPI00352A7721